METVLITGAASGLGAALAFRFNELGQNVVLLDRDLERAQETASALPHSDNTLALGADVRDSAQLHAAVDKAIDTFGQLDTVIPNAGIWDYNRSVTRLNGEEMGELFDELFAINVKGYLLTVEATWRHLVESEGNIIMTLSNAAFYAAGGGPVYTASKFADRGLMLEFAHELAPKVRVNGVAVGGMRTDLRGPVPWASTPVSSPTASTAGRSPTLTFHCMTSPRCHSHSLAPTSCLPTDKKPATSPAPLSTAMAV